MLTNRLIIFQKVTSRVIIQQLLLIAISDRIQATRVSPASDYSGYRLLSCFDFSPQKKKRTFQRETAPKCNSNSIPATAWMLEAAASPQFLGSSFSQLSEIISCPRGRQMHLLVPGLLLSFFHYQAGLVLKRPYPACLSNRADSFI